MKNHQSRGAFQQMNSEELPPSPCSKASRSTAEAKSRRHAGLAPALSGANGSRKSSLKEGCDCEIVRPCCSKPAGMKEDWLRLAHGLD